MEVHGGISLKDLLKAHFANTSLVTSVLEMPMSTLIFGNLLQTHILSPLFFIIIVLRLLYRETMLAHFFHSELNYLLFFSERVLKFESVFQCSVLEVCRHGLQQEPGTQSVEL